jgi:hypothetical protein
MTPTERSEINQANAQHSTGPRTLDQASALVQMHALKGEPYDPAEDGFVFSNEELEAFRHKNDVAQRAYDADNYCLEEAEYN